MKKNWMQIVSLALCAVLLLTVVLQKKNTDTLEAELAEQAAVLERQTEQIGELERRLLELENRPPEEPALADWSVMTVDVDTARRELTLSISVVPAEGRDIGISEAVAHRPGTAPGEGMQWPRCWDFHRQADGSWQGSLTLPYEEDSPAAVTVFYGENGRRHSRELGSWASMALLLPVSVADDNGEMGYSMAGDGRLYLAHRSVELANGEAVTEPVFRLVKNGVTAQEAPAEAEEPGTYSAYPLEMMGGLPCAPGDRVELHFACRDRFGIGYDFTLHTWDILSPWETAERWPESGIPVVTWPE